MTSISTTATAPDSALARGWQRWAPELVAVLMTLGLLAGPFTPFDGYDWLRMHVFYKEAYPMVLGWGEWQEWNPYVAMGRPLLADIEGAWFYPLNVVFLFGPVVGGVLGIAVHLAVALRGVMRLVLSEGGARGGAWLAAVGFALGAPLLGRLQSGQFQVFCTVVWWPWMLVALGALLRRPGGRTALALGAVGGMAVLAGNPPMLWIGVWLMLAWAVAHVVTMDGPRGWGRWGAAGSAAAVVALLLSAVAVLPFWELVGQGNREGGEAAYGLADRMAGQSWWSLLGSKAGERFFYWEYNLYTGVLVVAAAMVGLVLGRVRWSTPWALIGVGFAVLSLGEATPVLRLLVEWVPGWDAWRYPSRYAMVTAFALLMLAAEGCRVAVARWESRRRVWAVAAVVLVVANGFDLLRAYRERGRAYAHDVPVATERVWADLALGRGESSWPVRVVAPNWIGRENLGMRAGFASVTGFANPALAGPWEAVHAAVGAVPNPRDPVNLPLAAFQASGAQLAELGVAWRWDPVTQTFAAVDGAASRVRIESDDTKATVRLVEFTADRIRLAVSTATPGKLVVAEPWYPGWIAAVDGVEVPVERVAGWQRGVAVPAGAREVVLTFRSRWLRWGGGISGITALLGVGLWWWAGRCPSAAPARQT